MNRICLICGADNNLTLHHLVKRKLNQRGKFLKTIDTIDLCRECHDLVELEKVRMRWGLKLAQATKKGYDKGFQDGKNYSIEQLNEKESKNA